MELINKMRELDELFTLEYKKYLEYHKELDLWRGKELSDETAPVVQNILHKIQDQFILLYGVFDWVGQRGPLALKAKQEYELFMNTLKLAGILKEEDGKITEGSIH